MMSSNTGQLGGPHNAAGLSTQRGHRRTHSHSNNPAIAGVLVYGLAEVQPSDFTVPHVEGQADATTIISDGSQAHAVSFPGQEQHNVGTSQLTVDVLEPKPHHAQVLSAVDPALALERAPSTIVAGGINFQPVSWTIGSSSQPPTTQQHQPGRTTRLRSHHTGHALPPIPQLTTTPAASSPFTAVQQESQTTPRGLTHPASLLPSPIVRTNVTVESSPSLQSWAGSHLPVSSPNAYDSTPQYPLQAPASPTRHSGTLSQAAESGQHLDAAAPVGRILQFMVDSGISSADTFRQNSTSLPITTEGESSTDPQLPHATSSTDEARPLDLNPIRTVPTTTPARDASQPSPSSTPTTAVTVIRHGLTGGSSSSTPQLQDTLSMEVGRASSIPAAASDQLSNPLADHSGLLQAISTNGSVIMHQATRDIHVQDVVGIVTDSHMMDIVLSASGHLTPTAVPAPVSLASTTRESASAPFEAVEAAVTAAAAPAGLARSVSGGTSHHRTPSISRVSMSAGAAAVDATTERVSKAAEALENRLPREHVGEQVRGFVSQLLFVVAYVVDIVVLVVMIRSDWPQFWFICTGVFVGAPVFIMGMLILTRNGWLSVCVRYFAMLLRNEAQALMLPRWYALDWLRIPTAALLILIMGLFGGLVTLYCIVCFAITAVSCVPLLDLSTSLAAFFPFGWPRFKQRDLLLLEQYKATRYTLQLVIQSLPQVIVMALAVTADVYGSIRGSGPTVREGAKTSLTAAIIASLVLSMVNVIDKAWVVGEQLHLAAARGMRSEASMRGKWGRLVAWVQAADEAVDDQETAGDVDLGTVTESEDRGDDSGFKMWWLLGGLSATQSCVHHLWDLMRMQGAHKVPRTIIDSTIQQMLRSTSHFVVGSAETLATWPEEQEPRPSATGATPGVVTMGAGGTASARGRAPATPGSTTGGDGSPSAGVGNRRRRSAPVVANGFSALGYRTPTQDGTLVDSNTTRVVRITLVPHFLRPAGCGRLAPAQLLTVVREAMARYPRHAITTWAVEPPPGHGCLSGIILDGVARFKALQQLTICKCDVVGHGFRRVIRQLTVHPALTDLRLTYVIMDAPALGALSQLLHDNTLITRLELSHARLPSGTAGAKALQRLTRGIKSNRTLTSLTLSHCGITTQGFQQLCVALTARVTQQPQLVYVDLSGNAPAGTGMSATVAAVAAQPLCDLLASLRPTTSTLRSWFGLGRGSYNAALSSPLAAGAVANTANLALAGAGALGVSISAAGGPGVSRQGFVLPWATRHSGPLPVVSDMPASTSGIGTAAHSVGGEIQAEVPQPQYGGGSTDKGIVHRRVDSRDDRSADLFQAHSPDPHPPAPAPAPQHPPFTLVISETQHSAAVLAAMMALITPSATADATGGLQRGGAGMLPFGSSPTAVVTAAGHVASNGSGQVGRRSSPSSGQVPVDGNSQVSHEDTMAVTVKAGGPVPTALPSHTTVTMSNDIGIVLHPLDSDLDAIPENPPGCFGKSMWWGRIPPTPPLPMTLLDPTRASTTQPHTTVTIPPSAAAAIDTSILAPLPSIVCRLPPQQTTATHLTLPVDGLDGERVRPNSVRHSSTEGFITSTSPPRGMTPTAMTPGSPPMNRTAAGSGGGSAGSRLGWLLPARHRRARSENLPSGSDLEFTIISANGHDIEGAKGSAGVTKPPMTPDDGGDAAGTAARGWGLWRGSHAGRDMANNASSVAASGTAAGIKTTRSVTAPVTTRTVSEALQLLASCAPPPEAVTGLWGQAHVQLRDPHATHVHVQGLPVLLVAGAPSPTAATMARHESQSAVIRTILERFASSSDDGAVITSVDTLLDAYWANAQAKHRAMDTSGLSGTEHISGHFALGGKSGPGVQIAIMCDMEVGLKPQLADPQLNEKLEGVLAGSLHRLDGLPRALCSAHRLFGPSLLTSLDLSHLGIGDLGAIMLAEVIMETPSLCVLKVVQNRISDVGACALLDTLRRTRMEPLASADAPATATKVVGAHSRTLSDNIPGQTSATGASVAGAPDITATGVAPGAALHASFRLLDISGNQIGDEGCTSLCAFVDVANTTRHALAAAALAAVNAADAAAGTAEAFAQPQTGDAAAAPAPSMRSRGLSFPWSTSSHQAAEQRAAAAKAIATRATAIAAMTAMAQMLQLAPLTVCLHSNHYPFSMPSLVRLKSCLLEAARVPDVLNPLVPLATTCPVVNDPHQTCSQLLSLVLGNLHFTPAVIAMLQVPEDHVNGRTSDIGGGSGVTASSSRGVATPAPLPPLPPPLSLVTGAGVMVGGVRHSRSASHMTDMSEGDTGCGVCFDNPNNLTIRNCGHRLCVSCYRQLVGPDSRSKGTAKCPFCRGPIQGFEYRLGLGLDVTKSSCRK